MGVGPVDQVGDFVGVAGHGRFVSRTGQRLSDVFEFAGVVVDGQHPRPVAARAAVLVACEAVRAVGGMKCEREPAAQPRPVALCPDPAAVGLDDPLADGQAQPQVLAPVLALGVMVLLEQAPESVRSESPAVVRDGDLHGLAVDPCLDVDDRLVMAVAGGVGQQVVEHLHDAARVGNDQRQVRLQIDTHRLVAARACERVAGLVHQPGQLGRLGIHRQRARLNLHHVDQVREQASHVVGLLVDYPGELVHLGPVQRGA